MKNAREVCLLSLIRMEKDSAYSNIVLSSLLNKAALSLEERAFATRLFYGVLEKKCVLDFNIDKLSKKPVSKLDLEIRAILEMGMYQLLFMDSVPDNAAVNESVKLCTFIKKTSAKGFVNAVLRNKLRQNKEICLPGTLWDRMSADKSIVDILSGQYTEEVMLKIFEAFSQNQNQYIRVNTRKTTTEELIALLENKNIKTEICDKVEGCLKIYAAGDLSSLNEFKNGLFYVQDLSSQLCALCLETAQSERILDVCAAPGGKSFTIALNAPKSCEIVSCDLSSNRVSLIEKGRDRLSLLNIKPIVNDASVYNSDLGEFDRVLCDVPCSGLGVIAKKPEIRYKKIAANELYELQYKILTSASKYLKKEGILVYSTCTLNKNENEKVIENFLSNNKNFEKHPLCILNTREYHKTFLPHIDGCDGFFVSAVKRKS